ncbi:MAG: hypothetical protein E6R03_03380 [Hyphomicrobiaceae bacterium]|nr:MAG: hypothetical protein E6R03_03380 [Hyphomicrobiaceae bacterium]
MRVDFFCSPASQEVYEDARESVAALHQDVMATYLGLFDDEANYLDYGDVSGIQVFVDRNRQIQATGLMGNMRWIPEEYFFGFSVTVPIIIRWGIGL